MGVLVATVFIIVSLLLIVVVLLQKGKGGGLSGAFGGMGASAFGTRTGDVFTWITIGLAALFLLAAVVASLTFQQDMIALGKPTFVPDSRAIAKTTWITIQAASDADVFYTLDGTDPTRESIKYSGATIPIKPGTIVKAIAHLRGWKPSDIAVASYPLGEADADTTLPDETVDGEVTPAPEMTPAPTPAATPDE